MARRLERAREAYRQKDLEKARAAHTPEAIKRQIHAERHIAGAGEYLGQFVYGAIDGTVTTFAVVAGVAGAALQNHIVLILGFANLFADGFSMAASSFLSERAQNAYIARERRREEWEIEHLPEGERQEVREIFTKKGFKGKDLDRAVDIVTSDKKVWIDTMMVDELGLLQSSKSPLRIAAMTFAGFAVMGLIPLLSYLFAYFSGWFALHPFRIACALTLVGLGIVGFVKHYVTKASAWCAVLETMLLGGVAAAISYIVGYMLRGLLPV